MGGFSTDYFRFTCVPVFNDTHITELKVLLSYGQDFYLEFMAQVWKTHVTDDGLRLKELF